MFLRCNNLYLSWIILKNTQVRVRNGKIHDVTHLSVSRKKEEHQKIKGGNQSQRYCLGLPFYLYGLHK